MKYHFYQQVSFITIVILITWFVSRSFSWWASCKVSFVFTISTPRSVWVGQSWVNLLHWRSLNMFLPKILWTGWSFLRKVFCLSLTRYSREILAHRHCPSLVIRYDIIHFILLVSIYLLIYRSPAALPTKDLPTTRHQSRPMCLPTSLTPLLLQDMWPLLSHPTMLLLLASQPQLTLHLTKHHLQIFLLPCTMLHHYRHKHQPHKTNIDPIILQPMTPW